MVFIGPSIVLSMHVLSFIVDIMWSVVVEANLCRFVLSELQIWDLIDRFNLATCCCLPKPVPRLPTSYVVVFCMFGDMRWEVIVHFVNMGVDVDPRCAFRTVFLTCSDFGTLYSSWSGCLYYSLTPPFRTAIPIRHLATCCGVRYEKPHQYTLFDSGSYS